MISIFPFFTKNRRIIFHITFFDTSIASTILKNNLYCNDTRYNNYCVVKGKILFKKPRFS